MLTLLAEEDGVTQSDLVGQAFSDANTIGEMLTRLEKKRFVCRERHPKDGRARCVFLTPRGRKMQVRLWENWESHLQEVDNPFRPGEPEVLKSLLGRIPDAVAASRDAVGGAVA